MLAVFFTVFCCRYLHAGLRNKLIDFNVRRAYACLYEGGGVEAGGGEEQGARSLLSFLV